MTPREFIEVYKARMTRIEKDNENDNRRTARICAIIANANRDKKKKRKPFEESDFMPVKKGKAKKKQSVNSMLSVLKSITVMNKGKINVSK